MTNHQTEWITIRAAALALGVSELTIRRRIKDGRLAHRLINGKYYIDPGLTKGAPPPEHVSSPNDRYLIRQHDQLDAGAAPDPVNLKHRSSHHSVAELESSRSIEATAAETTERPVVSGFDLDAWLVEHARLAEMAGRSRLLEEQLAELSARHEELRAGMISLAGRNGWLESKLEERETQLKLLTDEQPRIPWWKRLFGG